MPPMVAHTRRLLLSSALLSTAAALRFPFAGRMSRRAAIGGIFWAAAAAPSHARTAEMAEKMKAISEKNRAAERIAESPITKLKVARARLDDAVPLLEGQDWYALR